MSFAFSPTESLVLIQGFSDTCSLLIRSFQEQLGEGIAKHENRSISLSNGAPADGVLHGTSMSLQFQSVVDPSRFSRVYSPFQFSQSVSQSNDFSQSVSQSSDSGHFSRFSRSYSPFQSFQPDRYYSSTRALVFCVRSNKTVFDVVVPYEKQAAELYHTTDGKIDLSKLYQDERAELHQHLLKLPATVPVMVVIHEDQLTRVRLEHHHEDQQRSRALRGGIHNQPLTLASPQRGPDMQMEGQLQMVEEREGEGESERVRKRGEGESESESEGVNVPYSTAEIATALGLNQLRGRKWCIDSFPSEQPLQINKLKSLREWILKNLSNASQPTL